MTSRPARCLTLFVIAIIVSGCCSTSAHVAFEPPPEPIFGEYTDQIWDSIPIEAQEIIVHDQLVINEYVDKVNERTRIHNE